MSATRTRDPVTDSKTEIFCTVAISHSKSRIHKQQNRRRIFRQRMNNLNVLHYIYRFVLLIVFLFEFCYKMFAILFLIAIKIIGLYLYYIPNDVSGRNGREIVCRGDPLSSSRLVNFFSISVILIIFKNFCYSN